MPAGLRIRNNGNILQIDGTYRNSELIQKGTLALNQSDVNGRGWFGSISLPASKSMTFIAFRAASPGIYWQLQNATTMQVFSGSKAPTPQPPDITYYIFGEPDIPISGGVGLIVRNAATGQVAYNSRKKYLRILQPINQQIPVDSGLTLTYPGKTVAICQCMRPTRWKVDTGGTPQQPIFVLSLASGTMATPDAQTAVILNRTTETYTGFGGNTTQIVNMLDAAYLIVDVTGY